MISAWKSTLEVLSVRIYASGKPEEYDGINMLEFAELRKKQLDVISKLPRLRRFHVGESDCLPNHYLPGNERIPKDRNSRTYYQCSLQLPTSVERFSLNFRVFDTYSLKLFNLHAENSRLTELDVTYIRNNVSKRSLV